MQGNSGKILLFDADNSVRKLIDVIIEEQLWGISLVSAFPDHHSLAICLAEKPDIILLDIFNTGVHGLLLCKSIKDHQDLTTVPVIALTERGNMQGLVAKAFDAGANLCLKKPLIKQELTSLLRMGMRLKTLEDTTPLDKKSILQLLEKKDKELEEFRNREARAADALHIEQEFGSQILNAMGQGMTITNSKGCFQYANPAFLKLLGYDVSEVIGKKPFDFTVQADHHILLSSREIRNKGLVSTYETRLVHKSGEIIKVSITGVPFYKAGDIFGSIAIITNITELKTIEKRLQKISDEYQQIFNATQDAMFLVKVLAGPVFRFIRTNKTHQEKTGILLESIAGKTPVELLGKELGAIVNANYSRCITEKKPIVYEEKLALPAGEQWWQTSLTPIIEHGEPIYIVGSSTNITAHKNLIEELVNNKGLQINKHRKRVLVAEDEDYNFEVVNHMLGMLDVDVLHATNGAEAVAMCQQDAGLHLVIMDMGMPVMDGYEATSRIKAFRRDLPVLALTAHAMAGDKQKALDAGCADYLSKPIMLKPLLEKVKQLLLT